MAQMLRERLRDLAEDAQVATPRPDTWARAQRSRRRRIVAGVALATASAIVVAAAAIGMVGPTIRQGPDPTGQPQYGASDLALPTTISQPSPWESGTDDAGPLGPIAILGEDLVRQTSWFHKSGSYYGISAIDGTYRFLDLPNLAPTGAAALSPDGTHIAYWTEAGADQPALVRGYAVYDTNSGAVTTRQVAASGALPRELVWSPDSGQVLAVYAMRASPDQDRRAYAEMLSLQSGASTSLTPPSSARLSDTLVAWGVSGIAFWQRPFLAVLDPSTGATSHTTVVGNDALRSSGLTWSPDGTRLAATSLFNDPGGPFLQVNSIGVFVPPSQNGGYPSLPSITRVTPFDAVYEQLGWRDDEHVLVLGVPTEQEAEREDSVPGIYSIDMHTGQYERLASVPLIEDAFLRGIATDIASNEFAARPGPAGHPDPRAVWARVASLLFVVAMIGVVVWQSRRSRDPARPLPDAR
jgi:hypothetical protein